MRIISEFKDYYDCIQRHGQDDDIVYIRKAKSFDIKLDIPKLRRHPGAKYLIGFCGKIYPCFKCGVSFDNYKYIYDVESLITYAKNENRIFSPFSNYEEKAYRNYFAEIEQKKEVFKWVFETYNIPIFIYYEHPWDNDRKLTINPPLNKFEFFRIKDPYLAFQEIYSFMSNLAKPEKPIPEMCNRTKIASRGFTKYSFRKDKQSKTGR